MAKWIARNSDDAWMVLGFGDPALIHSQPANYTEVEVPWEVCPNPRTERYDAGSPTKKRAATASEIQAYDQADLDRQVTTALDTARLTSAVVWTILKQMYPTDTDAQTRTKFGVARTRIIDAFKLRPWIAP